MTPRRSVPWLLLGFAVAASACSSSDSAVSEAGGTDGSSEKSSSPASAGHAGASGSREGTAGRSGSGASRGGGAPSGAVGSGGAASMGPVGDGDGDGDASDGGPPGRGAAGPGRGGGTAGASSGHEAGSAASDGSSGQHGSGGAKGIARDGGSPTGAGGGSVADAGGGVASASAGCGKTPTLKSSNSGSSFTPNNVTVSGKSRQFVIRWPTNYDNKTPYRLILDLHGYGGSYSETAKDYFGLWSLSKDTTIFIALSADGGDWRTGDNTAYVDEVLKVVKADLCIDTSRVMLEGFSQGAAMSWTLACSRPGVFRAAVGHSGGGVTNPTSCQAIPYFGSGGLQESVTQTSQTDQFAKWNSCTIDSFAKAPTGGHACSDYKGCSAGHPVRWCAFDGPHTPSPTDSGKSTSWMPSEVWPFLSQF